MGLGEIPVQLEALDAPEIEIPENEKDLQFPQNRDYIKSSAPRAHSHRFAFLPSPLKIIPPSSIVITRIFILPSKLGAPSREKLPIPGN